MNIKTEVLEKIEKVLKASDEAFRDLLESLGFENIDETIAVMNDFEDSLGDLLTEERKSFLINVSEGNSFSQAVEEIRDTFVKDVLSGNIAAEAESLLRPLVETLADTYMKKIDSDLGLETLSDYTDDFLKEWSKSLGKYMQESSQTKMDTLLTKGIDDGIDMDEFIEMLEENYSWSRERARRVSQTEVLTAHSYSQYEAYKQSPAVDGKTWKHSGTKGIDARKSHIALSGTTVGLDEKFKIESDTGTYYADMPRDVTLPPSERVYCHCTLGPAVDSDILGMSVEEKKKLRDEALADWNSQI